MESINSPMGQRYEIMDVLVKVGFVIMKVEKVRGDILTWYTHPKAKDHQFLLRGDRLSVWGR